MKKIKDNEINNPNKEPTIENIVDKKMNEMTIEEKITQMLIVYYYKDEVDSTLKDVFTSNTPATLSKKIVTDILKNDLGYQELIITDGLNMGSLTKSYSDEEIYIGAINAGCDLLLMPNGSKKAIEIIKKSIDEERINESVRKILIFKYTYLNKDNTLDDSYIGTKENLDIINQIK